MIAIVIHSANGAFRVDGPYEEMCEAMDEADKIEATLPNTECYVVRLYKRNKYGAPNYPWPTEDYEDERDG